MTAHSTGLTQSLFGETGLSLAVVGKVLLLLGLFAAFFSAVLLALTSYARSFKEAQAYIIPLMLLCLVPGIICLIPGLEFTGMLAVTPLVNIVLLARDVLEGGVVASLAAAAIFATALYVAAAIALAARVFGTDAVLYGSESTWWDILRRPQQSQPTLAVPALLAALAVMFPCYFVFSSLLARSADVSMQGRLVICGLLTVLVFAGIPWIVARIQCVEVPIAVAWRRPGAIALAAAALLGLALWPMAHEVFLLNDWLGIATLRDDQVALVERTLDQWQHVPISLVLLVLAVAPGICEELFFRGFMFTSLRRTLSAGQTIVTSALLFGTFHVLTTSMAIERFLPSTFLGLALGWVRHRTGSVLPCMVLHTIHNGLLLCAARWRETLLAHGWGVEEAAHLPMTWLATAVVVAGLAIVMLAAAYKSPQP